MRQSDNLKSGIAQINIGKLPIRWIASSYYRNCCYSFWSQSLEKPLTNGTYRYPVLWKKTLILFDEIFKFFNNKFSIFRAVDPALKALQKLLREKFFFFCWKKHNRLLKSKKNLLNSNFRNYHRFPSIFPVVFKFFPHGSKSRKTRGKMNVDPDPQSCKFFSILKETCF